jgi:hypothetical protein
MHRWRDSAERKHSGPGVSVIGYADGARQGYQYSARRQDVYGHGAPDPAHGNASGCCRHRHAAKAYPNANCNGYTGDRIL